MYVCTDLHLQMYYEGVVLCVFVCVCMYVCVCKFVLEHLIWLTIGLWPHPLIYAVHIILPALLKKMNPSICE